MISTQNKNIEKCSHIKKECNKSSVILNDKRFLHEKTHAHNGFTIISIDSILNILLTPQRIRLYFVTFEYIFSFAYI